MHFHLLNISFASVFEGSVVLSGSVCDRSGISYSQILGNVAQEASAPQDRHRPAATTESLRSAAANAAPNARWAVRTVAAKRHPKFTPKMPTPKPWTTGLIRKPTLKAAP